MGKALDKDKEALIRAELLRGKYSCSEVARMYEVSYNVASRILSLIKVNYKYLAEEQRPAHFGGKTEAYWTEEEALSSPYYNPNELKGKELEFYKLSTPNKL